MTQTSDDRWTKVDYVDDTKGPKWSKNSCSVDTVLWLAKVMGLGQKRLDEGFQQGTRLSTNWERAVQRGSIALLRQTWRSMTHAQLDGARDTIIRDWRVGRNQAPGSYCDAAQIWECIIAGLPSCTFVVTKRTLCTKHKHKTDASNDRQGLSWTRSPGLVAKDGVLDLGNVFSGIFSRFDVAGSGIGCIDCGCPVTETLHADDLPKYPSVIGMPYDHLPDPTKTINFRYYTADDVQRCDISLVLDGMVHYERGHYTGYKLEWREAVLKGAWFWNGIVDRRAKWIDASEVQGRFRRFREEGVQTRRTKGNAETVPVFMMRRVGG